MKPSSKERLVHVLEKIYLAAKQLGELKKTVQLIIEEKFLDESGD